jgi:hypothetical protein
MSRPVIWIRLIPAAGVSLAAALVISAHGAARAAPAPMRTDDAEPAYVAGINTPLVIDDFDHLVAADSPEGGPALPFGKYVTLSRSAIHLDAHAGIGGSAAVRFDWVPSTVCRDDSRLIEHAFPATPELYVQWSVRYTPGFVFDWRGHGPCTGNAKKIFFLWAHEGSRFDVISENHAIGAGSDNDHPLFAQSAPEVTPEQLADGKWHRFTFHVRQSSTPTATDGFIQGWIDGRLKWSRRGIATHNSGGYYDFKVPTTFNQGSPVAQSEWLDNLALWR